MVGGPRGRLLGVAAQQRVADDQVLGDGDVDPLRVDVREVAQPRGVRAQLGDGAAQVLVAGGADDRPVEPVGQLVERPGPRLATGARRWMRANSVRIAVNVRRSRGIGRRGLGRLPDGRRLEQRRGSRTGRGRSAATPATPARPAAASGRRAPRRPAGAAPRAPACGTRRCARPATAPTAACRARARRARSPP